MDFSFHPSSNSILKNSNDKVSVKLRNIAETILLITCGLFPLHFLPVPYLAADFSKLLIFSGGLALSLLFYTFSVLREGKLSFRLSWPVLALVLVAVATLVSAVVSGDLRDALLGDSLDQQSAAFVLLLAVTTLVSGIWAGSKTAIIRLYSLFISSALILALWHVIRLVFGSGTLSLGLFNTNTSSLLGGWNGSAIFFGLIIILSLLAIKKLPLTQVANLIIIGISATSLLLLSVIGFTIVWYVLAAVSVLMLLHVSSKHLLPKDGQPKTTSLTTIVFISVVAVMSLAFSLTGNQLNSWVGEKVGISYVEVRPSAIATVELTKETLKDDLFFGAGPNRFADVWRMYKDPVINQTIFWNTDFNAGFSYVGTAIIGTGLLGAIAWLLFFTSLLWAGIRFWFKASDKDNFWHFIGLSALVSTLYLWLMSWVYVPTASILILSAITTGVFLVAYCRLIPGRSISFSVESNRNYGFALIAAMVLIVTASAASLYVLGNQAYSLYTFNKTIGTVQPGDGLTKLEAGIAKAFNISQNDAFATQMAYYQWLQISSLLNLPEPTEQQRQLFETTISNAINSANLAISLDPTEPTNHQLLAQVYSVLAQLEVEGAKARALDEYALAQQYNPQNPIPLMSTAELHLQTGDTDSARLSAMDALQIRPNYTEAIFFLVQLDVSEGNTEQALSLAASLIRLEPQNPARRYQLGLLFASLGRVDEAIASFEQAVSLDPQYANARYFLAIGYSEKGRTEDAIRQLTIVRDLNEDNQAVDALIKQLKDGQNIDSLSPTETVEERDPESGSVTAEDLESDLVTSSNTVTDETSTVDTE